MVVGDGKGERLDAEIVVERVWELRCGRAQGLMVAGGRVGDGRE